MKKLIWILVGATACMSALASADEILPAAAATEDLQTFDQSLVTSGSQAQGPNLGKAISTEARKLRQEAREASGELGGGAGKGSRGNSGSAAESDPSNSTRNSGKKPADVGSPQDGGHNPKKSNPSGK